MKTTTLIQASQNESIPTRYDIKVSICANRLEFLVCDNNISVSEETLQAVLRDWLDGMRKTRRLSGQTTVL